LYTVEFYREYQRKKRISDFKEEAEAQANTWLSILVYEYFKCSGPITKNQEKAYLSKHNCTYQEFITEYSNIYLRKFTPETPYHLRTFSPNKGKNMNVTPNTNTVDPTDNVVGSEAVSNYYIDAEGNRVEIPFELDSNGKTAQAETEVFIAEDASDHPVTVH
jgi:hypothetical protein